MFTTAGRNELYGDAFNDAFIVRPGKRFNEGLAAFDTGFVDGGAMGTAVRVPRPLRPAATGPERFRPLLRARRCSAAPRSSSSHSWW